jgi:hypothetical protein
LKPAKERLDDQTPESLCKVIIARMNWSRGELVMEPARGLGNFYDNLPPYVIKYWCEIEDGRDFFQCETVVDTIITNAPYKDRASGRNLVIPFLEHSFRLAQRRVIFLVNLQTFNSMNPNRLRRWDEMGWAWSKLSIYSPKKWWGRYYLTFEKGGKWLAQWDGKAYD